MAWIKQPTGEWKRLYRYIIESRATFVILFGTLGSGASMHTITRSYTATSCAVLIVITLSVCWARIRSRGHAFPTVILDELSDDETYCWRYCSRDGLREACELTRSCLGNDFVESDVLEEWRKKCPEGFVQIDNTQGQVCACFVILGLTDSFTEQFIQGRLTESQIDAESILSIDEAKKKERLYLSGVVVREHGTLSGSRRAWVMFWVMLEYIENTYGLDNSHYFFAVAVTSDSENLMKRLKFRKIGDAAGRRDGHDLYEIELTKERASDLRRRIGDLSSVCRSYN